MWGFDFWLGGEYLPQYPAYPISVHHRGTVRFLPSPDGAYIWAPGYSDEFSADSKTIFDSNGLRDGYAEMKGWGGETPFVITSLPDPTDNSTWTWVLNLYGHGPTLHVPDYSNSGLCLAFAAGLLLFFRPRKEKA